MEVSLQEIEAILAENIRVLKVVVKEKRVRTLLKDRLKADPAFAAEYRANINAKAKARRNAKKAELERLREVAKMESYARDNLESLKNQGVY